MNLTTSLRRLFYNSVIYRTSGKMPLAGILGGLFLFAFSTFVRYYTAQPLQFLAALPFGFLILLPMILVLINLITLPILFWELWSSGNDERRIVHEQLKDEPGSVITLEEYAGAEDERRLHLRSFIGYSRKLMRKIRGLHNELAFRKDYIQRQGGELVNDPPSAAIREEILNCVQPMIWSRNRLLSFSK